MHGQRKATPPQGRRLHTRHRDHVVHPPRRQNTHRAGPLPRGLKWLGQVLRHPAQAASLYVGLRDWSQRTVIALVMQTEDNSLTLFPKRTRFGRVKLSSRQGHGVPNPTWIPAGNEAARLLAREIGGTPYSSIGEIFD